MNKEKNVINYYVLCNKLKNVIKTTIKAPIIVKIIFLYLILLNCFNWSYAKYLIN